MRCNIHDFDKMEEGKEIGRNEANIKAAKNMLSEGVDADKIAQWLDIPLETVQQFAEELKIEA